MKSLETENSSLVERCRVLELDCSSHNSELQQLSAVRHDLESRLTQLTDKHHTLTDQHSQVCRCVLTHTLMSLCSYSPVQRKITKKIRGFLHMHYSDRLHALGLQSLETRHVKFDYRHHMWSSGVTVRHLTCDQ